MTPFIGDLPQDPPPEPLHRHAVADGCGCDVAVGELVTFRCAELCLAHAVYEVGTLMVAEHLTEIPDLVQARDVLAQALAEVETAIKRATLRRPAPKLHPLFADLFKPLTGGRP